jgi:hypothetical protein
MYDDDLVAGAPEIRAPRGIAILINMLNTGQPVPIEPSNEQM